MESVEGKKKLSEENCGWGAGHMICAWFVWGAQPRSFEAGSQTVFLYKCWSKLDHPELLVNWVDRIDTHVEEQAWSEEKWLNWYWSKYLSAQHSDLSLIRQYLLPDSGNKPTIGNLKHNQYSEDLMQSQRREELGNQASIHARKTNRRALIMYVHRQDLRRSCKLDKTRSKKIRWRTTETFTSSFKKKENVAKNP